MSWAATVAGGRCRSAVALAAERRHLPGGGLDASSLRQDRGIFLSVEPRCRSGGGAEASSRRQRDGIVLPVLFMESVWLHRPGVGMEALSFRWKGRVQASSWQRAEGSLRRWRGGSVLTAGKKHRPGVVPEAGYPNAVGAACRLGGRAEICCGSVGPEAFSWRRGEGGVLTAGRKRRPGGGTEASF